LEIKEKASRDQFQDTAKISKSPFCVGHATGSTAMEGAGRAALKYLKIMSPLPPYSLFQ